MPTKGRRSEPVEESVEEVEESEPHLYRVSFRRAPKDGMTVKTWTFVTFGTDEKAAKDRIWQAYRGSSFQQEFDYESATVEFVLNGILKTGGN